MANTEFYGIMLSEPILIQVRKWCYYVDTRVGKFDAYNRD